MQKLIITIALTITLSSCGGPKGYEISSTPQVCEDYGYDPQYCESDEPEETQTTAESLGTLAGAVFAIILAASAI